jgi:succinate dehydrogenase / fumarate reductase cytochrome b subunit
MSSIALDSHLQRAVRFYQATIGKKVVMALTGVILFGYVVGHLLGNLQIYMGREKINAYAHFLHSNPGPLWAARIILLAAVIMHIVASIQLTKLKWDARPVGYRKKDNIASSYASRTMMWSGPIIAAFVIFHVMHLTLGQVGPYDAEDVYGNLVGGFQVPWISISYIVAMLLLGFHLYHGLWSMFQSIGLNHPRYTPGLKRFATLLTVFIVAGNISIPVAIMTGVVK